ncbi:MAG: SET domain-containing protein [Chloroflexota bacterium]
MLHQAIELRGDGVIEGHGLVAARLIKAGEVVSRLEPDQPTIAIDELNTMPASEQDRLLHYCYQCDETHIVCEQGIERYMNHSCDPNTWWADDETMIARRDIQPGEEITYDYATTEVDINFSMSCRCGSAACRGEVTNTDYQDPAWQARFGSHLPCHTLKAIARHQHGY